MNPQIGSDIAKLLGNLGKSTDSGTSSASGREAGLAFKRALAASAQAQSVQAGGKGLPAASEPEQVVLLEDAGARAAVVAAQHPAGANQVATTVLPEFDLHVVGAPVERLNVMRFAEEAGLSEEVLAQLFAGVGDDSAELQLKANELAESVAGTIAQWIVAPQNQSHGYNPSSTRLAQMAGPQGEPSAQAAQLMPLEGSNLSKLIAPALEAVGKDVGTSPVKLAEQLAVDIKSVLAGSEAQLSVSELQLNESIVNVVKPSVALWLDSKSSETKGADVSAEIVAENVARIITPKLLSAPALTTPELRRELEVAVAQWVKVSPLVDGASVSDAWIRDAAQRVSPAVSEWIVAGTFSDRQADQLAAQIAPQLTQALRTLGQSAVANPLLNAQSASGMIASAAGAAVGLVGVSETQLRVVRDNVLSQPQPITLTVMGPEVESGRSSQQGLAHALAQVTAPVSRPGPELLVQPQSSATLDRFALRGVGIRSDGLTTAKTGSAAALRDLVSARNLELAKLAPSGDKPLVASGAQQNPFASLAQGEAVDATVARSVGSSELSFRQSLANADRALNPDAGRINQFALNQNVAARELASRHLSEALGQRLAANIAAGHYRLTFNVNPRELGAIDVVMEMRDGRLDAQINASNAITRELLGDSLPRLRDALQQSGINLAQLQVGSESQQEHAQGRQTSGEQLTDQGQEEMSLADMSDDPVLEDLELGLDLDSVDFWA